MNWNKVLKFICVLLTVVFAQFLEGTVAQDEEGTARFHESSQSLTPCEYRRREGVCKRRSQCRRPTRRICSFGINPVVCCLDPPEPAPKPPPPKTTQPPAPPSPKTTKLVPLATTTRRPADLKEVDIVFPGCGSRSPDVPGGQRSENTERASERSDGTRRRGGFFSRRGKRDVHRNRRSGKFRRQIKPVIVGGQTAKAYSWPWMVAIFKQATPGNKRHLCGASLISRKYVLSAAHCFDAEKREIDASKFLVYVGAHTTNSGTEYQVEKVLIHPEYQMRQYYNDMSLLKLKKEVVLGKKVYPVCLPSQSLRNQIKPDQKNVTVTGWGDTSFGGVGSKVLQEVSIPIVPLKECNESYSKVAASSFPRGINNLFICAGVKEGGKDACQGDSGGPMMIKLASDKWVQLGVVSFGYGCARAGFPGVYTRVSRYANWLYLNTDLGT